MRERHGGRITETSSRSRRPSQQQQKQHAVYYEIDEAMKPDPSLLKRVGGAGGFQTGGDGAISMPRNQDGGGFHLVRHNSAVYEHDIRSSRTVTQLREELHLGLPWKNQTGVNGSGFPASAEESKKQAISAAGSASETLKLFTVISSQQVSKISNSYSLQNRRTVSLPVGQEYLINEYVGRRSSAEELGGHKAPAPPKQSTATSSAAAKRSISFVQSGPAKSASTDSLVRVAQQDAIITAGAPCDTTDFGVEVDRSSRSALFLQAAHSLLTTVVAVFTVYVYIRFLMSRSSSSLELRQLPVLKGSSVAAAALQGSQCPAAARFFFWCFRKLLASSWACPAVSLGILTAFMFAVISGPWGTASQHGYHVWSRYSDREAVGLCSHCEENIEDTRMRIEQADEKVHLAQQAKQQFMAYVFHNIRVPFNAIVLGLGHMQASGDAGEGPLGNAADRMDLVQMMLDCAETMTSVLDDVTDMGQWEVGQMELHSDAFDILAVIKFLSWGLKDLLQQKEIAFNMDVDEIVSRLLSSHFVVADKQRIVQTLGNFLSNAVKFTPVGGRLDLKVHCERVVENKHVGFPLSPEMSSSSIEPVTRTGDTLLGVTGTSILTKTSSQTNYIVEKVARLCISVKDNGIGISAEDQAKLFEPYSFVTSGWVEKSGVSGLGLSMAKRYVEKVGGNIGVKSSLGKGSTFFFSIPFPLVPRNDNNKPEVLQSNFGALPQYAPETNRIYDVSITQKSISRRQKSMELQLKLVKEESATKRAEEKQKELAHKQRKVLLVEDTRINRIILRRVLQNLNLQCDEAENGQVAVDLHAQGNSYDLVLMDKEMPVMDGHEATRKLRMMGVKTPIIALTGNALQSDRELFFEAGVNDFQTKPLSRDKLVQLLIRHGVESSASAI